MPPNPPSPLPMRLPFRRYKLACAARTHFKRSRNVFPGCQSWHCAAWQLNWFNLPSTAPTPLPPPFLIESYVVNGDYILNPQLSKQYNVTRNFSGSDIRLGAHFRESSYGASIGILCLAFNTINSFIKIIDMLPPSLALRSNNTPKQEAPCLNPPLPVIRIPQCTTTSVPTRSDIDFCRGGCGAEEAK